MAAKIAPAMGADEEILSKDEAQRSRYAGKLHFVPDAMFAQHQVNAYSAGSLIGGIAKTQERLYFCGKHNTA